MYFQIRLRSRLVNVEDSNNGNGNGNDNQYNGIVVQSETNNHIPVVENFEEEIDEDATYQSRCGSINWSLQPVLTSNTQKSSTLRVSPGPTQYAIGKVDSSPISAFRLFFSKNIMQIIVLMTNTEGRRVYKDSWMDIDEITINAYIGIILLAGVYKAYGQNIDELFDNNNRAEFRATFSKNKFKMLTRVLRFNDRIERNHDRDRDKLTPIRYFNLLSSLLQT